MIVATCNNQSSSVDASIFWLPGVPGYSGGTASDSHGVPFTTTADSYHAPQDLDRGPPGIFAGISARSRSLVT